MNKFFNVHESIDAYYGENCIYAAWDDNNCTELQLVELSHDSGYGCIGISRDELEEWEACTPGDDIVEEIKNFMRESYDCDANEDDYTSNDIDDSVAFFLNKSNNQYILVLNR